MVTTDQPGTAVVHVRVTTADVLRPIITALEEMAAAVRVLADSPTVEPAPYVASDATLTGDGVVSWALTIDGDLVVTPDVHPDRSITLPRADVDAIVAAVIRHARPVLREDIVAGRVTP